MGAKAASIHTEIHFGKQISNDERGTSDPLLATKSNHFKRYTVLKQSLSWLSAALLILCVYQTKWKSTKILPVKHKGDTGMTDCWQYWEFSNWLNWKHLHLNINLICLYLIPKLCWCEWHVELHMLKHDYSKCPLLESLSSEGVWLKCEPCFDLSHLTI